ncbi:TnsD family Tn7-like transposition protein [Cupriavidus necator]
MNLYLPAPFEDELFQSTCLRYVASFGKERDALQLPKFFGEGQTLHIPTYLSKISLEFDLCCGLSWEQLLLHHSLIPYLCSYQPPETIKQVYVALLKTGDWQRRVGIIRKSARHLIANSFRWCPDCASADRKKNGEAYWHIVHQICGMWACPIHGVELRGGDVLTGPGDEFLIEAAELLIPADTAPYRNDLWLSSPLKKLSERLVNLVENPSSRISSRGPSARAIAFDAGFHSYRAKDLYALEEHFEEYWTDALSKLDLRSHLNRGWLRAKHKHSKIVADPLCRTMLAIFMQDRYGIDLDKVSLSRHMGSSRHDPLVFYCPNPFAPHGEGARMASVSGLKGDLTCVRASCECGMSIKVRIDLAGKIIKMSDIESVNTYGANWVLKIADLVGSGKSLHGISRELNIAIPSVVSLYRRAKESGRLQRKKKLDLTWNSEGLSFICPNIIAAHGPAHNVENISIPERSKAVRLSCSCGLTIVVPIACEGRKIYREDVLKIEGGGLDAVIPSLAAP